MRRLQFILHETFLLLEYDRDTTIKQHGEKALSVALGRQEHDSYLHDVQGLHLGAFGGKPYTEENKQKAMHELMGQFEEVDPTPNKKYVQHIARIYGNGGVNRHEDIYARMKPALRDFHDLAKRKIIPAENRDIGKVKSLSELEDIVDAHKDKTSQRQEDAKRHEKMKSESTITDHPTFTHITPHTAEAAQHFGRGTKWCTAPDDLGDSAFDNYHALGNLHIMVPKNPKYAGEKYQGHMVDERNGSELAANVHDMTIMNDRDERSHEQLRSNHPEIFDHFNNMVNDANRQTSTVAGYDHPDTAVILKTLKNRPAGTTQEHIEKLLNNKNPHVVLAAARTGKASKADDRIYDAATKILDGPPGAQGPYGHDPGIAADNLIYHDPHSNVLEAIIDHPHTSGLNNKFYAASHPNLNKEAIDDYIDHKDPAVREGLAQNPSATDEHIKTLMKDEDLNVKNAAHETYRNRTYGASQKPLKDIIFHGKK